MKNILTSPKLSPIELAKRINIFRSLTDTKQDFDKIKESLVPQEHAERVNQIIRGLEQEDEFVILCRLMGACESISKIDQNPIIKSKEKAPDLLVSFHPGCSVRGLAKADIKGKFSCFVEVKSCIKKQYKISANDLKARTDFAARFKLPLIFAIRFTLFQGQSYWIILDSKKLNEQGRKVEVSQVVGTLGSVLLNDYCLFTHPQLHLMQYFSSNTDKISIIHKDYGILVKTVLYIPNVEPIVLDDIKSVFVNAIFENFEMNSVKIEQENDITCVISHVGAQARFLSNIIYKINNLSIDENGDKVYDPTRFVSRLDSETDRPALFTRDLVEKVIGFLNRYNAVFSKISIGDPKQHEKILRSYMRKG